MPVFISSAEKLRPAKLRALVASRKPVYTASAPWSTAALSAGRLPAGHRSSSGAARWVTVVTSVGVTRRIRIERPVARRNRHAGQPLLDQHDVLVLLRSQALGCGAHGVRRRDRSELSKEMLGALLVREGDLQRVVGQHQVVELVGRGAFDRAAVVVRCE